MLSRNDPNQIYNGTGAPKRYSDFAIVTCQASETLTLTPT